MNDLNLIKSEKELHIADLSFYAIIVKSRIECWDSTKKKQLDSVVKSVFENDLKLNYVAPLLLLGVPHSTSLSEFSQSCS